MKINFRDYYDMKQFCLDLADSMPGETNRQTIESLQRQLEESERKVHDLKLNSIDAQGMQVLDALVKNQPSVLRTILRTLYPENRIEQIKTLRTIYKWDLKTGKDFVDGVGF